MSEWTSSLFLVNCKQEIFQDSRSPKITLFDDLLNLLEEPSVTLLMHLLIYVVTNLIKNVQLL